MSTIDDLLSRRRRGALSEADERRVQMAAHTSPEQQLALLAGEAFDRAGAPQPGDAALIKSIVRQVEGEWSGTFQRVVARRRLSRWVSVPVLIAGVAAASFGGYRQLHAPTDNARPSAVVARELAAPQEVALEPPALLEQAPQAARTTASLEVARVAELPAPQEALAVPSVEASPLALEEPPVVPSPLGTLSVGPRPRVAAVPTLPAVVPPLALPVPASAPAVSAAPTRSWRLPRPKPHAERVAEIDRDLDLAAGTPTLAAPAAAAAGSAELEPLPDLESSRVLFRRAKQLRTTDWDAAAILYERLALRHSGSREAGVAEMALGKHALAEGRPRQALQWFEAYLRRPGGELAAEAMWGQARALDNLGERERARELWRRLIEQYPASAYAAAAREQLGP